MEITSSFTLFCVSGVNTTLDGSEMHEILYKNTLAFWTRSAISSHSASHFFCVSGGIADAERVKNFVRPNVWGGENESKSMSETKSLGILSKTYLLRSNLIDRIGVTHKHRKSSDTDLRCK